MPVVVHGSLSSQSVPSAFQIATHSMPPKSTARTGAGLLAAVQGHPRADACAAAVCSRAGACHRMRSHQTARLRRRCLAQDRSFQGCSLRPDSSNQGPDLSSSRRRTGLPRCKGHRRHMGSHRRQVQRRRSPLGRSTSQPVSSLSTASQSLASQALSAGRVIVCVGIAFGHVLRGLACVRTCAVRGILALSSGPGATSSSSRVS